MTPTAKLTSRIDRVLMWAEGLLPALAVIGAFVVHDWPARCFLLFYTAPLFLAAPLWVRLRLNNSESPRRLSRDIADVVVLTLAFARFVLGAFLPYSGHTLFLCYSILVTGSRGYRLLAAALLVLTTWFKLSLWNDQRSWALGAVLGVLFALPFLVARRPQPAPTGS